MSTINFLKNPTTKLLINHALCHLMLIPAFIYGEWWMFVLSFLWWQMVAIVSISAGYHRYYSHGAFKAGKFYEIIVNVMGIFSGAGPALTWAATHKQHHAYSDTNLDPHSYEHKGMFSVYVNTWGYNAFIKRQYIKRLMKNDILVWFYKNFYKVNAGIALGFLLIDPLFFVFGYAMPVVFAFHGYGILNILGHKNATPTNSPISNILTAGEGWHANHHKHPGTYYIGEKWWEFDPTKYFIMLIRK